MTSFPREARDGIMRAWLEILRERHPGVAWIPLADGSEDDDDTGSAPGSQVEAKPVLVA